ncbi:glycine betaine/L-proline ABC transporter substrate-binding protein ProX [Halomonas organivorans]|uniref:Glycine betaine/proline transport system substrate-binding protein n=1 Tax=Halomonas organivorans TaxID=257772 RepID=A0A7W5BYL9_9GAMM|nr:glycine betaine/L-proline ABC transporter substrate-binding protein ProX [Halomonas organivorans]MBB3141539.1 glycine betaine/proline transport system substrate-binding protein [Halomonas organivorans]
MYPRIEPRRTLAGLVLTLGLMPGVALADQAMPGEGVTVTPARATWDTGWFPAAVYSRLLEELGYDVKRPTTLDNPPFYQAVAQGDVDFWVNGWFPLHNTYRSTFEPGAELIGYVAQGGALQGYLVDKKTADEHGITHLEDFRDPEIAALFDSDGNGKAELVACPPGWGCELVIAYQLEAYGLTDTVEPIKAGYAASMADALGRYQEGGSIFFYTWTPNWTLGLLKPGQDVVWLTVEEAKLPEDQKQFEDDTVAEGVVGCVADPCNLGWPANDIRPVVNTAFAEANPAAAKLFEVAGIPVEDIFAQNARMFDGEDSADDIQRHADEWIAGHRDQVDGWLEQARDAAAQ